MIPTHEAEAAVALAEPTTVTRAIQVGSLKKPTVYKPVNNGWILENDHYYFKWFKGDQLPNYVSESLKIVPETDGEDDIEDEHSTEWNNSDEEDEYIDDNDENN
ncbi:hypothetical protein K1T71_003954 [Dendrolimus kikuchii]|uniref:Uncharacterized protein n=1 Tax=Dendrolimus kikuchii TaxID=765133 RepID=A0ACC1D9L8_9NEOP|nr:hypothetical protein K1T71_003954 [Dendrolimus kikuchii]